MSCGVMLLDKLINGGSRDAKLPSNFIVQQAVFGVLGKAYGPATGTQCDSTHLKEVSMHVMDHKSSIKADHRSGAIEFLKSCACTLMTGTVCATRYV
jgi:hypothetical protein